MKKKNNTIYFVRHLNVPEGATWPSQIQRPTLCEQIDRNVSLAELIVRYRLVRPQGKATCSRTVWYQKYRNVFLQTHAAYYCDQIILCM